MPPPCSICVHRDLDKLEAALLTGATLSAIAKAFRVGRAALHRHRAGKHVAVQAIIASGTFDTDAYLVGRFSWNLGEAQIELRRELLDKLLQRRPTQIEAEHLQRAIKQHGTLPGRASAMDSIGNDLDEYKDDRPSQWAGLLRAIADRVYPAPSRNVCEQLHDQGHEWIASIIAAAHLHSEAAPWIPDAWITEPSGSEAYLRYKSTGSVWPRDHREHPSSRLTTSPVRVESARSQASLVRTEPPQLRPGRYLT